MDTQFRLDPIVNPDTVMWVTGLPPSQGYKPLYHRHMGGINIGGGGGGLTERAVFFKGGRVMIAFFVNYSTVAFPLHLPTLKRQQFFGAVANSLGKNSYFPLPLDVRRCVAPTGEEVDARQRGVN